MNMSIEEQLAAVDRLEPFLVTIRDHLWSSPSGGRAAAFVGAGLSLNAEAVATGGPRMVVWREVAARMLQRLDPKRAQPGFGDEALHIAQEFEAAFGRRELDRLLKECIPDSNHEPSLLHRYLLQLPWADVFTTNQDTLLERTLPFVTNRKYDPVTSIEDISATRSPRIVKLHGSLPSRRPFIFTEEDFRTYPTRFSPFVNMVQQSMMENVFCLFGFSGDDPNFLNWSGWVRDALGEHAPVIYLIGVLELSDSRRRLLESRNVAPLDLAQVFPPAPHADPGARHKAALEWVLLSLMAGRPTVNTRWPISAPISVPEPLYSRDVQPLKSRKPESTTTVKRLPDDNLDPFLLYNAWKANRENYPGWVILPGDNRESLWNRTQVFYSSFPGSKSVWQHIPELEPHQTVLLLYETVWILERCLFPLQTDQADLIRSSLEKINPFPDLLKLTSALVSPTTQAQDLFWKDTKFDWREVAGAWVHLAFALMRLAREDLDIKAFTMWRDRLEPLGGLQLEWAARWSHEMTQYHLATLAEKQVREQLTRWPDTSTSPEWLIRKAAALAELGEFQKAQDLATQAVARVRRSLQEDQESVYFLSLESWALSSLQTYTRALELLLSEDETYQINSEVERDSYRERLEALKPYRCDPQSERNRLELQVSGHKPALQLENERVEERPAFDPGSSEVTRHIGLSTNYFEEISPAFGLLKLSDEGGYPLHCPTFFTFAKIDHAAEWIWSSSPLWAISAYLRSGKSKELSRWFTRVRVTTLSGTHVDVIARMLIDGGRQALIALEQADIPRLSYAHNILPNVLELLSRLCFRLNASQLDELSDFAFDAYTTSVKQKDYLYFKPLGNLLERVIVTLTNDKALLFLFRFMELPLSFEEGETPFPTLPEPRVFLDSGRMLNIDQTADVFVKMRGIAPVLLERVRHGKFQARWRAVWRLVWLYKRGVLSAEQQQLFTDALWSRLDSDGLPEATNMNPSSVLYLPEPEPRKAESALRKFLVSKDISPVVTRSERGGFRTSGGFAGNRVLQTWLKTNRLSQEDEIGIDWTADDVETLVDKLYQWSGEEPEPSHDLKSSGILSSEIDDRLYLVDLCLDEIIYPRAERLSDAGKENLEKLRLRLGEMGHQAIVSLPSSLCLDKSENRIGEVNRQLRRHLSSYKPEDVRHTLQAIKRWAYLAGLDIVPELPNDLLRELGNKILMRRHPELLFTITVMTEIISSSSRLLSDSLVEDLLEALGFLLSEVELPDMQSIDAAANQRHVFTVEERPNAFAFAAGLAAKLHQRFLDENKDVPKVLEEWQCKATSSVLPEVKSAFCVDASQ